MRYDNKNKTILLPKPLLGSLGRNFFRYLLVGSQKVTIFAAKLSVIIALNRVDYV